MLDALATMLITASLLLAAGAAVFFLIDRPAGKPYLLALTGLESLLAIQVVLGFGQLAVGDRPTEPWVFAGYLVGSLFVLPVGVMWSLAERSKWGNAVLGLAALVVCVLVLRMEQIWTASA